MDLEQEIERIRDGLRAGHFSSEAAVSQGIVLRLLYALGWPAYETQIVWPQYSLSGRRVDYALCHPASKPIAFVEVKKIGQSDGAERQLFEYAFHDGVPIAILTDGREWNFFLPAEQGDYGERRVYKLDLGERELSDCAARLRRYLLYSAVTSGDAINAARDDYRQVSTGRLIEATIPKAWAKLIADEDELLLEIVADRVESLCGFKPRPDMVAQFLKRGATDQLSSLVQPSRGSVPPPQFPVPQSPIRPIAPAGGSPLPVGGRIGFSFNGRFHSARNAIDVLRQLFETLINEDPFFAERFVGLPKHGNKRRYLARASNELYPGRPDLCSEYALQLNSGWWLGTNHSKKTIGQIIDLARDVADPGRGFDITTNLG